MSLRQNQRDPMPRIWAADFGRKSRAPASEANQKAEEKWEVPCKALLQIYFGIQTKLVNPV